MPLLSSTTLIGTLSILHLTVAYCLLASPVTILKQSFIFTLGTAMQLPSIAATIHLPPDIAHPATFANPFTSPGNPALGLAALFLAFLAFSDLTALSMREDVYNAFWTAQAPMRLGALFFLESWIYFYKPAPGAVVTGWSKGLMTDLVFSWAFVEMLVTFWVFLALRDEREEMARKAKVELEAKKRPID